MYLFVGGRCKQLTQPITFSVRREQGTILFVNFYSQHSYGCYEEMNGWGGTLLPAEVPGQTTLFK